MIRKLGAVSLLALGLVAGAALAQEGEPSGEAPVEQAPVRPPRRKPRPRSCPGPTGSRSGGDPGRGAGPS